MYWKPNITDIGNRLDRLLATKGLSYRAYAKKSGIPYSTLYAIRNGGRNPSDALIHKIADSFSVDAEWLKNGDVKETVGKVKEDYYSMAEAITIEREKAYKEGLKQGKVDTIEKVKTMFKDKYLNFKGGTVMAKYSPAQNKASQKYIKANLEEIKFRVPKGTKARYKAHAEAQGKSLTRLLIDLIEDDIKRAN